MFSDVDLAAYLQRIGHPAAVACDLPTLRSLIVHHVARIPFENLDPYCDEPVDLDSAAVVHKLVEMGRGGYCFEQNLLFGNVLHSLGFTVTGLAARVLRGLADDAITARSHMLLRIDLESRTYIVDVGFGGGTPTAPLELVADVEQATPHEAFRLIRPGADWFLQTRVADGWDSLYRFDLQPQQAVDYRVANYYVSTHPQSLFVNELMVSLAEPNRRLTLRGNRLTIRTRDGAVEQRVLGSAAALGRSLEQDFLIRLPAHPALDQRLADAARLPLAGNAAGSPR